MNEKSYKKVLFGKEARDALFRGIEVVARALRVTLGPAGRNAIFGQSFRNPVITSDGATIANQIILKDEIENLGAKAVTEAALKTEAVVGDGTTTSVILAHTIIKEGFARLDQGASLVSSSQNPMAMFREIQDAKTKIIEALKASAVPCETQEDLIRVATASLGYEEYGKLVGEMVYELGKEGFIYVEEGFVPMVETEIIKGFQCRGSYLAPFMETNEKKQAIWENMPTLITNQDLSNPADLKSIVEAVMKTGERKLALFAPSFGKDLAPSFYATATKPAPDSRFVILALKIPALRDEEMDDMAVFTGGMFFDQKKDLLIKKAVVTDLGRVKKIIATTDDVMLMGGEGNPVLIATRVKEIEGHIQASTIDVERKQQERRLGTLTSGIGAIRVGAKSDQERSYWKRRFDDAVPATKAALEEGVVKGGGLALKEIAEKLDKNILTEAIQAPYEQIKENSGEEPREDILDPVKVTWTALENACSIAGLLITSETAIDVANDEGMEKVAEVLKNAR